MCPNMSLLLKWRCPFTMSYKSYENDLTMIQVSYKCPTGCPTVSFFKSKDVLIYPKAESEYPVIRTISYTRILMSYGVQ